MSDNNGSGETKIIKTEDENGNVFNFELIDIIEVDGQEYGLLVMVEEEGEAAEGGDDEEVEEEVVLMRLNSSEDGYTFETIEDDKEFEKVISQLEFDEEEDEDECSCEFHHCGEGCDCGCEDKK
jgi:hypothetical protein